MAWFTSCLLLYHPSCLPFLPSSFVFLPIRLGKQTHTVLDLLCCFCTHRTKWNRGSVQRQTRKRLTPVIRDHTRVMSLVGNPHTRQPKQHTMMATNMSKWQWPNDSRGDLARIVCCIRHKTTTIWGKILASTHGVWGSHHDRKAFEGFAFLTLRPEL